ncbi:DEAD/DEAH box helicase [Diplocarpon rosae]|nr:DEAD/DEAH box helicase [Diplocarpon rosae]
MASQIYSRYIPPTKKSVPVAKDSPTPVLNLSEPSHPTPPATRHDASSTYARYIPPAKSQYQRGSADVSSQYVSKRKREDPVEPSSAVKKSKKGMKLSSPPLIAETSTAQSQPDRKEKKSSKKEKNKTIPATAEDRDGVAVDVERGDASTEAIAESMKGSKKERKTTAAQTGSFEETSPETILHDESASREPKPKKRKHRLAGEDDQDASEKMAEKAEKDVKHNKLFEKRQKSLKKAAKLAEKAMADGPTEDGVMSDAPVEIHDLGPLPQPEPVPELPHLPASASLPTWLASPVRVSPTTTAAFEDLGLPEDVTMILREKGYNEAFAVQAAVLPLLLPRGGYIPSGDVLVSAATGSGKTLSYVLPVIEDTCRSHSRGIRGLIVMPTRELVSQARQVSEACASAFSRSNGYKNRAKIGTAVGNETIEAERNHLMTENVLVDVERYETGVAKLRAPWVSEGLEREEEIFSYEGVQPALHGDVMGLRPRVDVLICTPGRLVEHIRTTPGFSLANLKWLVVDEADKLLDQSFQQWLPTVMAKLPSKLGQVRKVILSATMTTDVGQLNQLRLMRPKLILLEGSSHTNEDSTTHSGDLVVPVLLVESSIKVEDENIKPLYLMELLRREKMIPDADSRSDDPSSDSDPGPESSVCDNERPDSTSSASPVSKTVNEQLLQASPSTTRGVLIFTKSNEAAVRLGRLIALLSPALLSAIGTLTSTTPRAARQRTIASFASRKICVLVASDLVSRGLDLPNLAHVINYDVPNSVQNYIHRIGRTARAGKEGHAWTLYTGTEGRWFVNEIGRSETIKRANGSKMRRINIKEDAFADQRVKYEEALEILGKEANTSRARTS